MTDATAEAAPSHAEPTEGQPHPYHLVEPSPWPLVGPLPAGVLAAGAVMSMQAGPLFLPLQGAGGVAPVRRPWWPAQTVQAFAHPPPYPRATMGPRTRPLQ